MRKIVIGVFLLLAFCKLSFAEPFFDQWEWERPRMFGKVKIIIKEEAVYTIKQIFNNQGKRIEEQLLNNGTIIYKTIFNYDDSGKLSSINRYSSEGKLLAWNKAIYENGVLKYMESNDYPQSGKFYYDAKGFLDEIVIYGPNDEKLGKYVFKFNQYGNLVEKQTLNALLELREKKVFFYNDKGFPVGELTYNPEGLLIRKDIYQYEYDDHGNWIHKQIQSEVFIGEEKGKSAPTMERRKFTYFNI